MELIQKNNDLINQNINKRHKETLAEIPNLSDFSEVEKLFQEKTQNLKLLTTDDWNAICQFVIDKVDEKLNHLSQTQAKLLQLEGKRKFSFAQNIKKYQIKLEDEEKQKLNEQMSQINLYMLENQKDLSNYFIVEKFKVIKLGQQWLEKIEDVKTNDWKSIRSSYLIKRSNEKLNEKQSLSEEEIIWKAYDLKYDNEKQKVVDSLQTLTKEIHNMINEESIIELQQFLDQLSFSAYNLIQQAETDIQQYDEKNEQAKQDEIDYLMEALMDCDKQMAEKAETLIIMSPPDYDLRLKFKKKREAVILKDDQQLSLFFTFIEKLFKFWTKYLNDQKENSFRLKKQVEESQSLHIEREFELKKLYQEIISHSKEVEALEILNRYPGAIKNIILEQNRIYEERFNESTKHISDYVKQMETVWAEFKTNIQSSVQENVFEDEFLNHYSKQVELVWNQHIQLVELEMQRILYEESKTLIAEYTNIFHMKLNENEPLYKKYEKEIYQKRLYELEKLKQKRKQEIKQICERLKNIRLNFHKSLTSSEQIPVQLKENLEKIRKAAQHDPISRLEKIHLNFFETKIGVQNELKTNLEKAIDEFNKEYNEISLLQQKADACPLQEFEIDKLNQEQNNSEVKVKKWNEKDTWNEAMALYREIIKKETEEIGNILRIRLKDFIRIYQPKFEYFQNKMEDMCKHTEEFLQKVIDESIFINKVENSFTMIETKLKYQARVGSIFQKKLETKTELLLQYMDSLDEKFQIENFQFVQKEELMAELFNGFSLMESIRCLISQQAQNIHPTEYNVNERILCTFEQYLETNKIIASEEQTLSVPNILITEFIEETRKELTEMASKYYYPGRVWIRGGHFPNYLLDFFDYLDESLNKLKEKFEEQNLVLVETYEKYVNDFKSHIAPQFKQKIYNLIMDYYNYIIEQHYQLVHGHLKLAERKRILERKEIYSKLEESLGHPSQSEALAQLTQTMKIESENYVEEHKKLEIMIREEFDKIYREFSQQVEYIHKAFVVLLNQFEHQLKEQAGKVVLRKSIVLHITRSKIIKILDEQVEGQIQKHIRKERDFTDSWRKGVNKVKAMYH